MLQEVSSYSVDGHQSVEIAVLRCGTQPWLCIAPHGAQGGENLPIEAGIVIHTAVRVVLHPCSKPGPDEQACLPWLTDRHAVGITQSSTACPGCGLPRETDLQLQPPIVRPPERCCRKHARR